MSQEAKAKVHNVAAFMAILAGVYVIGTAIGRGPLLTPEAMEAIVHKDTVWMLHIASGGLALFGIFVADKNLLIGRAMIALAGVMFLSCLFFFREFGALALLGIILPAVVLIAAAPLIRRPFVAEIGETPESRPAPR